MNRSATKGDNMTLVEKLSIAVAIVNALTLVIMATALVLQSRAVRHSQWDTELALLGIRSQSLATLIAYLDAKAARIEPSTGLDAQRERSDLEGMIAEQISYLDNVMGQISKMQRGA